ncbi:VRR-NUC domain protein [Actinomyces urogenitalis DSM 15434]|uniref:VRR-NUC domain protein n=1 Tax=Actinomyces urogenitalis DSM 15434 TaxID=525246 RepID=C0W4E1_9ACTO|nr:VRR-NUC domain-containing protein [Actinomyces urogenitalis]EEH66398.1 VRR-NUC domain protein [Actinomyces urogenitalis DSM 15434]MBS5976843.1 VRR-NUC domain-containing protein [Actinomyces urogenitalis]
MRERAVEAALVREVRARGGLCWKLVSPGTVGVPDRLVLLPAGHVGLVEVKAPGERPRAVQRVRIDQVRALGTPCLVLDDPAKVGEVCDAICSA